jgi:hypothetical protein
MSIRSKGLFLQEKKAGLGNARDKLRIQPAQGFWNIAIDPGLTAK